jgi:hypothetical protein
MYMWGFRERSRGYLSAPPRGLLRKAEPRPARAGDDDIRLFDYQGMIGLKPVMSISKRLAVSTLFDK